MLEKAVTKPPIYPNLINRETPATSTFVTNKQLFAVMLIEILDFNIRHLYIFTACSIVTRGVSFRYYYL